MNTEVIMTEETRESFFRWLENSTLETTSIESALTKLGISNAKTLRLVGADIFVCTSKERDKYLMRLMSISKELSSAWIDHANMRQYLLIKEGNIMRATK